MKTMQDTELKIGKHYRCEYRLTGIDCKVLNWTAGATGIYNVSGGNRLAFSAVDGRTLTVSQAKWGQLAAGMEIFIHTTAADPDGPRIAKIAKLDQAAGTITLTEDLNVPAEALANVGKWIGAAPELTRPEPAFAAGAYVFATGKHAAAVGRNVAAAADESFIVGADGELPGTPEYEGAVAVAHGGELALLVKHYEMRENAETGEPERVKSVSLKFAGTVIANEFRKADGTPIGGGESGFPATAADGDIMMWRNGEDRGNTTSCKFLLQPSQSGGLLVDSAHGNGAPVPVTNNGATVDADGNITMAPGTYASIPANTLPTDVMVPDKEWTVDVMVRIDSCPDGGAHSFFGYSYVHGFHFGFDGNGNLLKFRDDAGDINAPYTLGSWALMTLEYYYDAANVYWVQAAYLDGALVGVKNNAPINGEAGRGVAHGIGAVPEYWKTGMTGKIRSIRIRNVAPYRGTSFVPQALPWLPPGPGSWKICSLASLKNKLGIA